MLSLPVATNAKFEGICKLFIYSSCYFWSSSSRVEEFSWKKYFFFYPLSMKIPYFDWPGSRVKSEIQKEVPLKIFSRAMILPVSYSIDAL